MSPKLWRRLGANLKAAWCKAVLPILVMFCHGGEGTEPAELEPGRCVGATSVAMPWELRGTQGRLPSHEVLAKALDQGRFLPLRF